MAGEGEILKNAREVNGWSYADIEEIIKIRARYLQAMEDEDYRILPGDTYARGFLRMYARHLGLDPEEVISLYNKSSRREKEEQAYPPLTPIQNSPVWFKPVVLLVMAILAVVVVIGIAYFSKTGGNEGTSNYTPPPLPAKPEIQAPQTPEAPTGDTSGQASGTGQKDASGQNPSSGQQDQNYEGIVAEMTFTGDCWLKIRVDGKSVEQGTQTAGSVKTVEAADSIEFLSIGNAGGLSLKLNGKEIPPLGKSGEVIRDYLVTKDTINKME